MKRLFSLILLIVAISGLIWITGYTLTHKGIRAEVKRKVKVDIEKVTSNENKNNLSEVYNIYLAEEKHKVKIEYQLVNKSEETIGVTLYVYVDGKNVMEREVVHEIAMTTIPEVMKNDDISNIIRIHEKRFHYLKDGNVEFLIIDVGVYGDYAQRNYYILNNKGELLNEEGILVSDTSKNYMLDDEPFEEYYDNEEKLLARLDNNIIYALEEKNGKKHMALQENKYFIKDGKLEKELIKTYENISLKAKNKDIKK